MVTVVVLGLVAGSGYVAWHNYQTGVRWQQRSVAAEADVVELEHANQQLNANLGEVQESLERSEADVGELEHRVGRLANEKARVEDEREQANAMTERIAEIAIAYEDVAQWFQACRGAQSRLTQMVLDLDRYTYSGQYGMVSDQIDNVGAACGTAEGRLADLRRYVDALAAG